ncbi:MAG: hypothetical protein RIC56_21090 [Pseudomonadales bacterium]
MDALWVFLTASGLTLAYTIFLVRASIRGKQWAVDTLKATSCLMEGPAASPLWLELEREAAALRESETESAVTVESELIGKGGCPLQSS